MASTSMRSTTEKAPVTVTPTRSVKRSSNQHFTLEIDTKLLAAGRSSRSSGKPIIQVPLQGAPPPKPSTKPAARHTPITKPQPAKSAVKKVTKTKRTVSEVDTDTSRTAAPSSVKRTPTKKKLTASPSRRPTPSSAAISDDDSDASSVAVTAQLLASKGKKAVRQLATPKKTPTGKQRAAPSSSSPSKPPTTARAPRRSKSPSRASSVASTSRMLVDSEEDDSPTSEDESSSADELALTPLTSPTKPKPSTAQLKTPSPRKHLSSSTNLPTPRRSSTRAQRLPVAQADIEAVPLNLRSVLVGWHQQDAFVSPRTASAEVEAQQEQQQDSGDESELEVQGHPAALERSAAKSTAKTTATTRTRIHTTPHNPQHLHLLLRRCLSVLSGASLPVPFSSSTSTSTSTTKGKGKQQGLMDMPYLEGGYQKWEQPMRYALKSVVEEGVGNCLVLLGPRGVGKSMIFERSIDLLTQTYGAEGFIPVRLSGLVHTTDRMALRSIAWQLKVSGLEEEGGDFGSNAATMTTLLRLLEPSTVTGTSPSKSARPTEISSKPIIILLDEFDLFAQHPRQSFLYCLLDIVQGNRRKKGMGVVGLSSRSDCLSILEKRVRSRCQSQVHQMVLKSDFEEYLRLARELMSCDLGLWKEQGEEYGAVAEEWMAEVEAFLKDAQVVAYFKRCWQIYGNTPTQLRAAISHMLYSVDHSTRHSTSEVTSPAPTEIRIPSLSASMLLPEPKGSRDDLALSHLTILELNVLIAAKHLRPQHDNTLNLEMLYKAYLEHVQRGKINISSKPFTRAAFCMAFDHLRSLELFLPHVGKPAHHVPPSQSNPFKMFRLVPWDSTIDEAFKARNETKKDVPEELKKWCKDWVA